MDGWMDSFEMEKSVNLLCTFEIYLGMFFFIVIFRAREHQPFWLFSLNISSSKANVSETLSQQFYDRIDQLETRKYLYLIVLDFRSFCFF